MCWRGGGGGQTVMNYDMVSMCVLGGWGVGGRQTVMI